MKRLILLALLFTIGCGGKGNPVAPAPVVPECQLRNSATLILVNNALSSRDAYLDGAFIATLGSSGGSITRDVSAGVAHPVVFRSSINGVAVSSASPNIIQCQSFTLTNSF